MTTPGNCDIARYVSILREATRLDASIQSVEYFCYRDIPERPAIIRFTCGETSIFVIANADDDTIWISKEAPSDLVEMGAQDHSSMNPWTSILGTELAWGWALTNQEGYIDGVQFQFHDGNGRSVRCIQMMVLASTISVADITLS